MPDLIRLPVAVLALALAASASAGDIEGVKADWGAELARYDDVVLESTSRGVVRDASGEEKSETRLFAQKLGPNQLAYLVGGTKAVSVANEKYFFSVNEAQNGGWTLGSYGRLDDPRIDKPLKRLNDLAASVLAGRSLFNIPIYPNLDAFRIESETDEVLSLVATREFESDSLVKIRLTDIRLRLDKKNRHRLLGATYQKYRNGQPARVVEALQWSPADDRTLQMTLTKTETYGAGPSALVLDDTHECQLRFRAGLKPEDFRLTAYGLPEPNDVVWEKPTPTYVWLLAAAGGFGLLALAFAYLKRRAARRAEAA